ncbi:MAG: TetR/AcrR family transcriptional regulator C-terminal domain-containing protein [Actinomycetota bacterium]|uniref:TetR/AcrR family transcriptional regulator C-terminal domain-containing protein n=1 Tax=Mycobacterium lentiflavum TaxID=141349 RepID=A0ABY3ULP3_MYCLN|nr:TetR/AcrR family transcriptional regulator C-terminal domain-containing protein [Mycobacterium lentiflavum]MEE3062454.1 TetR/AcrR family transcriptional regulator C-terminal domain-containing protein [Actinomycetota bacterium]ULP40324.1 TetR/AcrR family transcriptional regulator C-terminal domain-containing protein [Mycobacterium lentiflavum]
MAAKPENGLHPMAVWERPEPVVRPAPTPLSRDAIVAAAIALADEYGLAEVSLRKVAATLGVGPMRLYGYVATKDELLQLMVDEIWGEIEGPLPGGWREVLTEVAHRIRAASRTHCWFVGLLGGRPQFGPYAFAHREEVFAALSRSFDSIEVVLHAYRTVLAYVTGALQSEHHELRSEQDSGLDESAWQVASWPYLRRMLATGNYPTLVRIVQEAKHPPVETQFENGLNTVLAGVATQLPA